MDVREAAGLYMADKGARLRPNTLEGYESALRAHVLPRWGEVDLADIRPEDIQLWVDGFPRAGAAEKAYKTLRQVIRWCLRRGHCRMWDPTSAGVELPRREPRESPSLTAAQEREMLRGIWGAPFEAVVLCQAACGLRRSEACALEWTDIDLRAGTVRVERGVHSLSDGSQVTLPPKSARSRRTVALPRFAVLRLRRLRGSRRRGRLCDMSPAAVARALRAWCARLGLPWVPMMQLRHSWARIALAGGARVEWVSLALGHTSLDLAYSRYLSRDSSLCRRAARCYGEAMLE